MSRGISRRDFFSGGLGMGLGALLLPGRTLLSSRQGKVPLIVTSHTNRTGQNAVRAGYEVLSGGGSALDAVERAANIIELDPEDMSVGYGGAPNEHGVVQLDASIRNSPGRNTTTGPPTFWRLIAPATSQA